MKKRKLNSLPTIRRLPSYLHVIKAAKEEGIESISGTIIADELELEPIQVRKDLALTGIIGKPRIGYPVNELILAIEHYLRWDSTHLAVLIGAGNLGQALLGYSEFKKNGLSIITAFDTDEAKIGGMIQDVPVCSMKELRQKVQELDVEVAILTVPSSEAQQTADTLVECGISGIWNFTNVKLKVPDHVIVQKEDLSSGYAVLSLKMAIFNSDT